MNPKYKERLLLWLKKEQKHVMIAALAVGTMLTVLLAVLFAIAGQEERMLRENFFRFHVLANSDSEEDQALKLLVRDAVLEYLQPQLEASQSKEETKAYMIEHLAEITDVAGRMLRQAGSDQKVQVVVGVSEFPRKSYGSVTLPAGRYESLRIEIGAAQGHNWWCVMFPTLCFVDETSTEEMEADLAEQLPDEQNELIHEPRQFKFKLVEWYYKLFG